MEDQEEELQRLRRENATLRRENEEVLGQVSLAQSETLWRIAPKKMGFVSLYQIKTKGENIYR